MLASKHLRIVMTGASGFVGSHLSKALVERGCQVVSLGRAELQAPPVQLAGLLNGVDVVVNLAGAPIIGRWTEAYKKILYQSRIDVTRAIVGACSQLEQKPALFISTSAVGYYSPEGVHTEARNARAEDFLGRLCQAWEQEALAADALAIRTVIFRFGIVLGRDGGALKQMLLPFTLGLGGRIGSGKQALSWIHIHDLIRAYLTVIDDASCAGIYNLTAPNPTDNNGLTRALSRALSRPAFLPVPSFALRLRFGEGAQVLTSGQAAMPERLLNKGFVFEFSEIDKAVRDCVS